VSDVHVLLSHPLPPAPPEGELLASPSPAPDTVTLTDPVDAKFILLMLLALLSVCAVTQLLTPWTLLMQLKLGEVGTCR
jgi:hypothetical protein